MHIGSTTFKSKRKDMFFSTTQKQARTEIMDNLLSENLILPNDKKVHFDHKFKYLGSIITPFLNEDAEIDARIGQVFEGYNKILF
jgi:hypothetical protein